jgi:transposase InsO family protein
VDFFTIPTAFFQVLYVFVVLRHDRRRVVHFHVTAHPTSVWVTQQLREAFPFDQAPRFLLRDRDGSYGESFRRGVARMGIEEVLIAPQSPWQNPFAERVIGSIRRECLDHGIVLSEAHLRRILRGYLAYYHDSRTHRALDRNAPNWRSGVGAEKAILAVTMQE